MTDTTGEWTWPGLSQAVSRLESDGVVSRTFRRLDPQRQEVVLHAILAELPLQEALFAYVYCGCDWMKQEGLLMKLFARAAYTPDSGLEKALVEPVSQAMFATVRELLQLAIQRGELSPKTDIETASAFLHANLSLLGDTAVFGYLNSYFRIHQDPHLAHLETTIQRWVAYLCSALTLVPSP